MKRVHFYQTMQMKLIIIYVLLITIAMQVIGVYFVRTMEDSLYKSFSDDLQLNANLLAEYVSPYLQALEEEEDNNFNELKDVVNQFQQIMGAEIQVIDRHGVVLSSSFQKQDIGKKSTDSDVSRALQGIENNARQVIDAFQVRKSALALPVKYKSETIGAVYIMASMEEMFATIDRVKQIFLAGTIIALVLTAFLGVILSNTITTPIKDITKRATQIAEGNYNQNVAVAGNDEIANLAMTFNYMTNRLQEALSSIQEEKNKLASILINMSDGVIAIDDQGNIILINHKASDMLQVLEQDIIGKKISHYLSIPYEQMKSTQHNTYNVIELEHTEQKNVKVRVTFTSIYHKDSRKKDTIIVLQDVTQQEQLEQLRKDFVANVSHELRTPLTTIKSYLEALEEGAVHDEKLALKFIGVTRNESDRMIRIVNDLLQLSRLDSRQTTANKEFVSMELMLEEVADRFSFQAKQKHIHITWEVEDGIAEVFINRDLIDQVLDNLVSNAIKYTLEYGRIYLVGKHLDSKQIEIKVQDSGIGIPQEDLDHIFERFYRVDKARSRNMGGTGLGLSIAREIVKEHGGDISIQSKLQEGTTVTFTLPVVERGEHNV
ncbi:ATP-binding protein [Longirhabdus pacifica]|uniref:ATP-binding protein n=1 Tax=Longirhabdus pacifica TaxID=2305227 RepID=UPI001008CED0|nr:ATP-binding protein [Longirhabdus pacifica]